MSADDFRGVTKKVFSKDSQKAIFSAVASIAIVVSGFMLANEVIENLVGVPAIFPDDFAPEIHEVWEVTVEERGPFEPCLAIGILTDASKLRCEESLRNRIEQRIRFLEITKILVSNDLGRHSEPPKDTGKMYLNATKDLETSAVEIDRATELRTLGDTSDEYDRSLERALFYLSDASLELAGIMLACLDHPDLCGDGFETLEDREITFETPRPLSMNFLFSAAYAAQDDETQSAKSRELQNGILNEDQWNIILFVSLPFSVLVICYFCFAAIYGPDAQSKKFARESIRAIGSFIAGVVAGAVGVS